MRETIALKLAATAVGKLQNIDEQKKKPSNNCLILERRF